MPPSTGRTAPVMYRAPSLARNRTAGAMSSGCAGRPSAMRLANAASTPFVVVEKTIVQMLQGVGDDERVLAAFTNRIALGRPAQPDDIAPAVLFLASEGARYITGAVLPVDGGTSASTGQPHL